MSKAPNWDQLQKGHKVKISFPNNPLLIHNCTIKGKGRHPKNMMKEGVKIYFHEMGQTLWLYKEQYFSWVQ